VLLLLVGVHWQSEQAVGYDSCHVSGQMFREHAHDSQDGNTDVSTAWFQKHVSTALAVYWQGRWVVCDRCPVM